MRNPLNVLGGNLGDWGEFCKGLILLIIDAIFIVIGDIYLNRLGFQTLQEIVESLTTPTTYNFIFIFVPVMSLVVALIDTE